MGRPTLCTHSHLLQKSDQHKCPWLYKISGSHTEIDPLTHFILETPKGVLAKSGDPDQMPHDVASDLGLHYFASCSAIFQQIYIN